MKNFDNELEYLARSHAAGRLSRRDFMGRAVALGASASFLTAAISGAQAQAPRKGGTFRLGLAGGSTTDSMNPASWSDTVMVVAGHGMFNTLVENDPNNKLAPDLAESWEPRAGGAEWIFNLRKGVQFHNGKDFTAEDAIYSLNLHRGQVKSAVAGPMKAIADIKKLGSHQIQIILASADADFPYLMTDYHIMMVPEGHTDWSQPIGTGCLALDKFQAGVRISLKRHANFWRQGRGNFDAAEITVIGDSSARMNALIAGQVDAINRTDPKTLALIEQAPNLSVLRCGGGWHTIAAMAVDAAPFDNPDVRLAMKYAVDRKQVLQTMFNDFGALGNDHPISRVDPNYHSELPQRAHDPDKAAFHLKKAGINPKIVIQASEAAFNGAVDMATLMQASGKKSGLDLDIKREPADGFWSKVWLKGPCVVGYWGGRPAATQMLGVAYASNATWNETHFKNEKFDKLLADARSELDPAKRKSYIWAMQEMLHNDGGAVIPMFRDSLDSHSKKVGGMTAHAGFDMLNGRVLEKAWLNA